MIPSAATLVVIVVGLDAVGRPIGHACHRPERVAALTGRTLDDPVRPVDIATVVAHRDGGRKSVPADARTVLALTKAKRDDGPDVAAIRAELAGRLPTVAIADR